MTKARAAAMILLRSVLFNLAFYIHSLLRTEMDAEVADRMRPAEILFEIGPLVFDRPGAYEFLFFANERHVGQKSFNVVQIERPTGESR